MEAPVLARADGTLNVVEVQGALLGIEDDQEYPSAPFQLEHGDWLVLTTDGITEARRGREFLGDDGFRRLVTEASAQDSLEKKAQSILSGAREFAGGDFRDDVCLVLARRQ